MNAYRENKRLIISIHALREEGDFARAGQRQRAKNFYPRPPRGGRLRYDMARVVQRPISIHALREEGDASVADFRAAFGKFLSTPSARRATTKKAAQRFEEKFLSTPSARRATSSQRHPRTAPHNFYPRPPRGGRLHGCPTAFLVDVISIHALREEGDAIRSIMSGI